MRFTLSESRELIPVYCLMLNSCVLKSNKEQILSLNLLMGIRG